ncbi:MAG: hypothetical protein ACPG5P_02915, partial [Saprospiraceae bacterium]
MKHIITLVVIYLLSFWVGDGFGNHKPENYISNPGFENKKIKKGGWFDPGSSDDWNPDFLEKSRREELHKGIYGTAKSTSQRCYGLMGFREGGLEPDYTEFLSNELVHELDKDSIFKLSFDYSQGISKGTAGYSQYYIEGMGVFLSEKKPTIEMLRSEKGDCKWFKEPWYAVHCEKKKAELYFKAEKSYRYITIGFFAPLAEDLTKCLNSKFKVHQIEFEKGRKEDTGWAYYFLDDFVLTKDFPEEVLEKDVIIYDKLVSKIPNIKIKSIPMPFLKDSLCQIDFPEIEFDDTEEPSLEKLSVEWNLDSIIIDKLGGKAVLDWTPRINLSSLSELFFHEENTIKPKDTIISVKDKLREIALDYHSSLDEVIGINILGFAENTIPCDKNTPNEFGSLQSLSINRAEYFTTILSNDFGVPREKIKSYTGLPDKNEAEELQRRTEITFQLSDKAAKNSVELSKDDWITFLNDTILGIGIDKEEIEVGELFKVRSIEKSEHSLKLTLKRSKTNTVFHLTISGDNMPIVTFRRINQGQRMRLRKGVSIYKDQSFNNLIKETQPWEKVIWKTGTINKKSHSET